MNNLDLFIADSRRSVDDILDKLIPSAETEPGRLHEAIRWSLFPGGKRFRPVLVFAAGETFAAPRAKLLRTAAAIEMVHTYSLIHDDLPSMDNDDLRRGRETCHKKFGDATAILAGDALQALAFQVIADDESSPLDIRLRLISDLACSATKMVAGQQMDLEAEGESVSIEKIEQIHRSKTGELVVFSAKAGAVIGGASTEELQALAAYASKLGLLFQITDDLLDVTQTTKSLGKTAGKDVSAEKATYPSFYGINETRKLAHSVYADAIECLEPINRQLDLFHAIAHFIRDRIS